MNNSQLSLIVSIFCVLVMVTVINAQSTPSANSTLNSTSNSTNANPLWISGIPSIYVGYVAPFALILIGFLVEKKFVGRVALFSNTLALNLHLYVESNPNFLLAWYANIGLALGIIGIISYAFNWKREGIFYDISWLYMSIIVGILILIF